jgi:hypothetical protein
MIMIPAVLINKNKFSVLFCNRDRKHWRCRVNCQQLSSNPSAKKVF